MSTRTTHSSASLGFFLALLFAACEGGCSSTPATNLAQRPLHPLHKPAATASEHRAHLASNSADVIGASGAHANHTPTMTVADRALTARVRFYEARAVMERAIMLREADPTVSVAALDASVKEVSNNLAMIERMLRPPSSDTARTAADLMQEWYRDGMQIIEPPPEGLLELPLPFSVKNKANAVASALDRLVEETSEGAPRHPIASRKEGVTGSVPTSAPVR
jgi:hypothetical protein